MLKQNELLRRLALANFSTLLKEITAADAMLIWLDGAANKKEKPNENYAREFLELFTLSTGNFTEADVRSAARSFTGWRREHTSYSDSVDTFVFEDSKADKGLKT